MEQATRNYYDKRGEILVKNLQKRHFEAYYCATKEDALKQVLRLMPEGSTVGWGGAVSAAQVGVQAAVHAGNYTVIDRDQVTDPAEKNRCMRECFNTDFFITDNPAVKEVDAELMNMGTLVSLVWEWFEKKGLKYPVMQMVKVQEEVGELARQISRNKLHDPETEDALGDILVTIIGMCHHLHYHPAHALALAYNEIKDRKGKVVEGSFVKDE